MDFSGCEWIVDMILPFRIIKLKDYSWDMKTLVFWVQLGCSMV